MKTSTGGLLAAAVTGGAYLLTRALRGARLGLRGRVVLITGGSRGLGLCLARVYAREGADLVLLARDEAELDRARVELEQHGIVVLPIACDVTARGQVEEAVRAAVAKFGRIDVVVNNAGDIEVGPLDTMLEEDFARAMETNFWGALHVSRAALPFMRIRGEGRIVNISSVGGLVALPHLLPYTASKFALTGFSYGLRAEVAKDGVLVTTVCPGLMRTGSAVNALFKGKRDAEFAWFYRADSLPLVSMSATRAARAIVRASQRGDARLILTPFAKLGVLVQAVAPGLFARVLAFAHRLLPAPPLQLDGAEARRGMESRELAAESWLTALGDRAAVENNEVG